MKHHIFRFNTLSKPYKYYFNKTNDRLVTAKMVSVIECIYKQTSNMARLTQHMAVLVVVCPYSKSSKIFKFKFLNVSNIFLSSFFI